MTWFVRLAGPVLVLSAGACGQVAAPFRAAPPPNGGTGSPAAAPAPRPPAAARTADDFDTTTAAQRAEARRAGAAGGQSLGAETVALGDPTLPGLWLKTALVSQTRPGRIETAGGGRGARVELRPLEGEGGATLSLAAMRLLEIPLTDLPRIEIYGL